MDRGCEPDLSAFLAAAQDCAHVKTDGQADLFPIPSPPTGSQVINDRCVLRTVEDRRVVLVSGIVLAHYAVGDRIAEAHARINLVDHGWADQNDVARVFGCSTRTVRRDQRRFDDGGMVALGHASCYPPGRLLPTSSPQLRHRCKREKRLMIGPPGAGKSMVAKRIPSIMPPPGIDERLEILSIHSAAGRTLRGEAAGVSRPFRAPHHTVSDVALLGGGSIPGPGEISLAHHGVLFLDELPEFKRSALEVMRQPIEDGEVTISRSAGKVTLPCAFMLVAAMNPCPCGYLGDSRHECRCTPTQIQRYRARISGPLLDRIDLHIEAPALSLSELRSEKFSESSASIRERVRIAREIQSNRFRGCARSTNARMSQAQIRRHCAVDPSMSDLLQQAMEQLSLSARAYDRILKVARTIADLAGTGDITSTHLLEAIQYRSLDRRLFY